MDQRGSGDLAEACRVWQSGRDGGSSRLRGAARVLTGIDHYFQSAFISDHEREAQADPRTMAHGRTLLEAVAASTSRDADAWCAHTSLPPSGFAGRGLKPKPDDDQIVAALTTGEITMPLWGVSLNRAVAESFGTRFLLEIEGPFQGVAAWIESGVETEQKELITGGRYEVVTQRTDDGGIGTHVTLRQIGQVELLGD